jgi:cytochrome c biogenesis protein CcdA/thiol-disulfide isomerase/thioredoxin
MLLLMLFALLAGAGTAITPCVLPVLPAILAAGADGGRRRPIGIVLGLAITFTIAIVALAQLVKGVGLAASGARDLAIIVLFVFGIVMLVPELSARLEAPLSRLARFGPKTRGSGFWSGLGVGAALGFVVAPCAGPILAAVTSVSASSGATPKIVLVALSYAVGLSAVLLVYVFAGRAVIGRIRGTMRGPVVERALGVILVATAFAMVFNLDVRFEDTLAQSTSLPSIFTDPTKSLENSNAVQNQLASLRPRSAFADRQAKADATAKPAAERVGVSIPGVKTPALSVLGTAPAFTGNQDWFNTPGDKPLTLAALRGHVVIVDFWTYTCINCIRTLPYLKRMYATYHRYGLDIVGVETPEFTFEQEASNVRQAISADGIKYPVVQDNRYGTWNAYHNQYWPAEYFIDAQGKVRHVKFGEGDYEQDEAAIRQLLFEAGAHRLPPPVTPGAIVPSKGLATPETYIDPARAVAYQEKWSQTLHTGTHTYQGTSHPTINEFSLDGIWSLNSESATAVSLGASITGTFQAQHVYLVMTSAANIPRTVQVLLDGKPIAGDQAGSDVHDGRVTVRGQRLYSLVSAPDDETGTLTVKLPPGVSAYDFTFG